MAAYEIEDWYAYDWSTTKYGIRSVDAGLGSSTGDWYKFKATIPVEGAPDYANHVVTSHYLIQLTRDLSLQVPHQKWLVL